MQGPGSHGGGPALQARPSGPEARSARQRGPGSPARVVAGRQLIDRARHTHSPHIRLSAVASHGARTTDVRVKYRRLHGAVERPAQVYCLLARAPVAPPSRPSAPLDLPGFTPKPRHDRRHNHAADVGETARQRPIAATRNAPDRVGGVRSSRCDMTCRDRRVTPEVLGSGVAGSLRLPDGSRRQSSRRYMMRRAGILGRG